MSQTNSLQKFAPLRLTTLSAITTITSLVTVTPLVHAQVQDCGSDLFSNAITGSNTCGDKEINFLGSTGINGNTLFEFAEIIPNVEYDVGWDFLASGAPLTAGVFDISYRIDIDMNEDLQFDQVGFGLDGGVDATTNDSVNVVKEVFYSQANFAAGIADQTLNGIIDQNGTFGDPNVFVPDELMSLWITDTITVTGQTAFLNDLSNDFFQEPDTHVPEPGTILGLFAVGGLGLGLKGKKQGKKQL